MDELTQLESLLNAANDAMMEFYVEITGENLRAVAARDAIRKIDFYLPTVLGYIRHIKQITHKEDTQ